MHHEQQTGPTAHERVRDFPIRVIVAGSRGFDDYRLFCEVMDAQVADYEKPFIFISGKASSGADAMIIRYAKEKGHPWAEYPADWDNLDAPGAVILENRRTGKLYNARAGYDRNEEMGDVATNLIVFWDNVSKGTKQMLDYATKRKLRTITVLVDIPKKEPRNGWQSESGRSSHSQVHREAPAW